MKFFSMDNPIFQKLGKLCDGVFLSLIWLLFSIPLITIGASTSAAYHTANKVLRHDRGYIFREFWQSFKSSFKQATLVWMLCNFLILFMLMDARFLGYLMPSGSMLVIFRAVFLMFIFVILLTEQYIFPHIARFQMPLKKIITNCLFIAFRHFLWSLLLLLLLAICVLFPLIIPLFIFITPYVWSYVSSLIIERIFIKYMTEEEIEKEKELNRIDTGEDEIQ